MRYGRDMASAVRVLAVCAGVLWGVFGCAGRQVREEPQRLDGLELPLRGGAGVRAEVDGSVGGVAARVFLDVAAPITMLSTGCFGPELPKTTTFVRFLEPGGEWQEAPEIDLPPARLGDRRVGSRRVALYEEDETCVLVLGSDVLMPYALEFDPERRVVRVLPTRPRGEYVLEERAAAASAGDPTQTEGLVTDFTLIDLTREPKTDWPLLAVRLKQGRVTLTGTFVLSSALARTRVGRQFAVEASLKTGPDFVRELGVPEGFALPRSIGADTYAVERVELSPDFGVRFVELEASDEWKAQGVIGVLGGDVWGKFVATIDPAAGVLALRRPKVVRAGSVQRCVPPGPYTSRRPPPSEDACFVLNQRPAEGGTEMIATVWRELPKGARVYLDLIDEKGQEISSTCRLGLTFGRSDRGVSAAHRLPWSGLGESMPDCAAAISSAAAVRFSLWEEGALDACPGQCAFVQDALTYQTSCECQSGPLVGASDAEQKFIEMYRRILEQRAREPAEREPAETEPEPGDPK